MKNIIGLSACFFVLLFSSNLFAQNFVVVKGDSKFFQKESSIKPFVHSRTEKGFLRLELIEEKTKRVRVKMTPERPACYSSTRNHRSELHLWVNRRDLEKVTTDVLLWEFKDGSQVELASGMVVKKRKIITKDGSLRLKIPEDKTGFSFRKKYLFEPVLVSWEPKKRAFNQLASKKGLRFSSNKFFRRKKFSNVEKVGDLDEIRSKCVRVRGELMNPRKYKGRSNSITGGLTKPSRTSVIPGQLLTLRGETIGRTTPGFSVSRFESIGDLICQELVLFAKTKKTFCVPRNRIIRSFNGDEGVSSNLEIAKVRMSGGSLRNSLQALERARNRLNYCMVKGLISSPVNAGIISFLTKVGMDGKVISSTIIRSTINSEVVKNVRSKE